MGDETYVERYGGGVVEGEAAAVIERTRVLRTEDMVQRFGQQTGYAHRRITGTVLRHTPNLCPECGADVGLTVSGGSGRRLCPTCFAADE
jgi:hypothetical protein